MRNKPPSSDDDWDAPNPLRLSASLGQLGVCRCLIDEFHQDINQFELGRGPIMRDSLAHPEVVALLLKSGADVHKSLALRTTIGGDWISDDATALHFAAQEGVPGTITLLLDNGIDMLARTTLTTQNGKIVSQTALDVAAYYGRADNMEAMVTHSKFAEIDKTQRQELLDRCIILGVKSHWYEKNADRPNLIKVLLDNGANPNAANGAGLTPIQAAVLELSPNEWRTSRVAKQIAVLLRERGAKLDLFSTVGLGDDATVAGATGHLGSTAKQA